MTSNADTDTTDDDSLEAVIKKREYVKEIDP